MPKGNEGSKTVLVVDIAHNNVSVGVLILNHGIKPLLLAAWQETFEHIDPSHERMFATTLRSMRKLIEKAELAGYTAWDDIYCSIGSPWVLTHVRSAKYARDKQFVVTNKLLGQLKDSDKERFIDRLGFNMVPFSEHPMILDHELIATRVNGHMIKNPMGQRARDLECTYLVSGMNPDYAAQLRSALYAVAHREPVIHAVHYIQLRAIQLLQGATNFALFDFHGGVGECTVVRDGIVTVTATTPISEESYITDVAKKMGMPQREVLSLMRLESKAHIAQHTLEHIDEANQELMRTYARELRDLLVAVAEHGLIPNHALYIADSGSRFFGTLLQSNEFASLSVMHDALKPIRLSRSLFNPMIDAHALHNEHTAVIMAALAYTNSNC